MALRVPVAILTLAVSLLLPGAAAETARVSEPPLTDDEANWFRPPAGYAGRYGEYRSPLLCDDGTPVKTAAEWQRRREEILKKWHGIMGSWPPLLQSPKMTVLSSETRENFTQKKVRIEVAPDQFENGILLVPGGTPKFPAVLVPFYDPETSAGLGKPMRDFAYQLTKRGFVTLSIGSPGGDARKPKTGEVACQPLSFLGYIAANCANLLAGLPEVDSSRIGIVGHSYGGKWAMFGSCLSERFACAAWSDPGIVFDEKRPNVNYWDPWYLGAAPGRPRPVGLPDESHPRTGAYKTLREQGMDLHELHALMAPRPFMVSGGAEDPPERWIPLNHAIKVNDLLGYKNRVAMTNRATHEPTDESNATIYRFFELYLNPPARTQG